MRTFSVLLLLLAFSISTRAASLSPEQQSSIDRLISQFQDQGNVPAVSVLIDQGGSTLYRNTSGSANLEYDQPVHADSVYAIGSITKTFTALATLLLVEQGSIDLDAPVTDYLHEYQGPAGKIAVRHLLMHTSGIPNYTSAVPGLAAQLERNAFTRAQMVDTFASLPLSYEPGEKFSYTNSGYYLLGLIIEAVSGQTYYEFLQENVFDPLELRHTHSGDDAQVIKDRVSGYALGADGQTTNAPTWSHLVPFSAGSIVSTLDDLVRYRRGVFHHPEFAKVSKRLVQQLTLNDGTRNIYALGALIVSEPDGRRKLSHSGDIWGFSSNHAYYPEEDLTIVVLVNRQTESPSPVSLEQKIARVIFKLPAPTIEDLSLPADLLDAYAGDYELHPFIFGPPVYGFIARDGKLYMRFGGIDALDSPMIPLLAQDEHTFVTSFDDEWTLRFYRESGVKRFEARARDGVFLGHAR